MKIAINGIGVAGPTLAYWLRRFGHEPTLFERAPELRRSGYVIDFWGLGYDLAERMGIVPVLRQRGYFIERLSMVDAVGREVAGLNVAPLRDQLKGRFVSIARADLAAALYEACEGIPAHFGISIVGVAEDAHGVTATLSNGQTERFDLVIGADGLHSTIRELVFGRPRSSNDHLAATSRRSGSPAIRIGTNWPTCRIPFPNARSPASHSAMMRR